MRGCTDASPSRKTRSRTRARSPALCSCSRVSYAVVLLGFASHVAGQGLSFIWYFEQQNDASIPQCETLSIGIGSLPNATTPPVPPYYLITYPMAATPVVIPAPVSSTAPWAWQMGYPAGTQIMLGMVDSKGNSGGVVRVYNIATGASNCEMFPTTNSDFSFSINPAAQPRTCQEVAFSVQGGTPPYTVTSAISMDTAVNSTFVNSSISVQNMLSGGATYMLALSDSTGQYAASSDLIYSGGGGDTSCLVNQPSTSTTTTPKPSGTSTKTPAIVGAIVAIVALALAAGAFLLYRRRKKAQHDNFMAARMSAMNGGGSSDAGSSGPNGREKFVGPMGYHGSGPPSVDAMGAGGGMWRPESPTEYPGITSAPVRFRVTNPDDDARSEYSLRTGGAAGQRRSNPIRESEDTIRNGRGASHDDPAWAMERHLHSEGRDRTYQRDPSQRLSLIESDVNALYPPTSSYRPPQQSHSRGTGLTAASFGGRQSTNGSTASFEDADAPWPTYTSSASSETEEHYTDQPASSATILRMNRSRNRGPGTDEMDVEEMYVDEVYSPSGSHLNSEDTDSPWRNQRRDQLPSRFSVSEQSTTTTESSNMPYSPSNAYASPFADSQRVT